MVLFRALRLTFFCLSFLNGTCPYRLLQKLMHTDWAVYHLAGDTHRRSAVLLYASSYVTWTFQTHTFSNSIEAVLVSCSLVTVVSFKHDRVSPPIAESFNKCSQYYHGQHSP
jgi:phosphatidylinositol glycan class Z